MAAYRRVLCLFIALISIALGSRMVAAQELRIETDVYVGSGAKPVSHTITLFDSGTVYDFVDSPAEIAVFRPPTSSRAGQFILLDLDLKQRTDVSTDRIDGLMNKLSKWAKAQDDPMLQFSARPEFEETFDAETGSLTLDNELWNYTVATVPSEDAATLRHYREFTDWYTRLNTMVNSSPPPGPRLALNAALEKHCVVPVEIRRTVDSDSTAVRATHLFSWRLSRADRARLDEAREYLASFEKVNNEQFLAHRAGENVVRGQSR